MSAPARALLAAALATLATACIRIPSFDGTGDAGSGSGMPGEAGSDSGTGSDGGSGSGSSILSTLQLGFISTGDSCPVANTLGDVGSSCEAVISTAELAFGFAADGPRFPRFLNFFSASGDADGLNVFAQSSLDGNAGMPLDAMGYIWQATSGGTLTSINSTTSFAGSATLTVLAAGRAAIELHVHGTNPTSCNLSPASWDTDYTAYPDGRVVHHDSLSVNASVCGFVATTATFAIDAAPLTHALYRVDANTMVITPTTPMTKTIGTGAYQGCASAAPAGSELTAAPHVAIRYGNQTPSAVQEIRVDAGSSSGGSSSVVSFENVWQDAGGSGTPADTSPLITDITYQIGTTTNCYAPTTGIEAPPAHSPYPWDPTHGLYTGTLDPGIPFSGADVPAPFAIDLGGVPSQGLSVINQNSGKVFVENTDYIIEPTSVPGHRILWFPAQLQETDELVFAPL